MTNWVMSKEHESHINRLLLAKDRTIWASKTMVGIDWKVLNFFKNAFLIFWKIKKIVILMTLAHLVHSGLCEGTIWGQYQKWYSSKHERICSNEISHLQKASQLLRVYKLLSYTCLTWGGGDTEKGGALPQHFRRWNRCLTFVMTWLIFPSILHKAQVHKSIHQPDTFRIFSTFVFL